MLCLTLNSNGNCVGLDRKEDPAIGSCTPGLPILDIWLEGQGFSVPLDTLRGWLNELEMAARA